VSLREQPGRTVALVLTGVLLLVAVWELAFLWPYIDGQHALGSDLGYYRSVGERWLDTGQFYLPRQLAGPYTVEADVDVLYPPVAIPFFVALRWLPVPLWWAIPLAVIAAVGVRLRPALWTWPLLVFCAAWPRNLSDLLYGNSNMWVIAAVAGGVVAGWPGVLVALKPSLAPFALVGARRRSWWIAAVALGIASVLTLGLWLDYLTAVRNSDAAWYYSLEDAIPLSLPIIAWLGRRDGGFATLRELLTRRPRVRLSGRGVAGGHSVV
jgi:hypothetical protein